MSLWMLQEFIEEQRDERFPLPHRMKFSLNIYSPETWEVSLVYSLKIMLGKTGLKL